jgi:benzoyl-CoA reductase/2-hydroxyglutaryl-CoA dehydratase subunit BcrC/BadD/HgdB
MDKLLNKFASIAENPYPRLAQWKKETGRKIIGCFPMRIPEEIIHAAGMLPVTLLGTDEAITLTDQYTHTLICRLARANFDLGLKGKLDFFDAVVSSDLCLTSQMISDIWRFHRPAGFYYQLIFPKNVKAPYAKNYLPPPVRRIKGGAGGGMSKLAT